jgi:hypothetical protein
MDEHGHSACMEPTRSHHAFLHVPRIPRPFHDREELYDLLLVLHHEVSQHALSRGIGGARKTVCDGFSRVDTERGIWMLTYPTTS